MKDPIWRDEFKSIPKSYAALKEYFETSLTKANSNSCENAISKDIVNFHGIGVVLFVDKNPDSSFTVSCINTYKENFVFFYKAISKTTDENPTYEVGDILRIPEYGFDEEPPRILYKNPPIDLIIDIVEIIFAN